MDRFIPSIVGSQKCKFDKGFSSLRDKREHWDKLAERAVEYFGKIRDECNKVELFEDIYVVDSREREDTKNHLPHITLFFGQHPVGYEVFNSKKLAVERGCSLVISQSVMGNVVAIYYPFGSELARLNEEYLIASAYDNPWSITDIELHRLAKRFFSYAQVSSVYGSPSLCDKASVFLMRINHWWLHFKIKDAVLKLIGKASEETLKKAISGSP